jgi:hypothetical protein
MQFWVLLCQPRLAHLHIIFLGKFIVVNIYIIMQVVTWRMHVDLTKEKILTRVNYAIYSEY